MKKDRGYLRKQKVADLMLKSGYGVEQLLDKLAPLLLGAGLPIIDEKTLRNWLSATYEGSLQVIHAEMLADIFGVELREIFIPREKFKPVSHDEIVNGVLTWKLNRLGKRDPFIALYNSLDLFKSYYKKSIDLMPSLRAGHGAPWRNKQLKQYTYALMTVSLKDGKSFKGLKLIGDHVLHFYWAPFWTSNVLQFLSGYISLEKDVFSCHQPWTTWSDHAKLADDGKIRIAFWLDLMPADFVLYNIDPKFTFEVEWRKPTDKNSDISKKIFQELAGLSSHYAFELRDQLQKMPNRNYIVFTKQPQHRDHMKEEGEDKENEDSQS